MLPRYKNYGDFSIARKKFLLQNRKNFLLGLYPIGFVFFHTHEGNSFHILDNDGYTYCSKKVDKPRVEEFNRVLVFKKLSETKGYNKPKLPRYFHKRRLCVMCENRYIGLSGKERYTPNDGHQPLFEMYEDKMIITDHLIKMLESPLKKNFPKLTEFPNTDNFKFIITPQ